MPSVRQLASSFALSVIPHLVACSSGARTPDADSAAAAAAAAVVATMPMPVPDAPISATPTGFLGLRTVKYTARDLAIAKAWYIRAFGIQPYFDQPFYVGFNVGGYELGIVPDSTAALMRPEAGLAYWGVTNADSVYGRLILLGASHADSVQDVGDGVRIGAVRDPFGNLLGIVTNPGFKLPPE